MEAEALPLINILDLKEDIPQRIPPPAPAVSYSGHKHGIGIHVVRNGEHSDISLATNQFLGHRISQQASACKPTCLPCGQFAKDRCGCLKLQGSARCTELTMWALFQQL